MSFRIYIGNLSYQATEKELEDLFNGTSTRVENAKIITDFNTGRSRGFAFIEVATHEDMQKEIQRLNGFLFKGRKLVVCEAKPKTSKGSPLNPALAKSQAAGSRGDH